MRSLAGSMAKAVKAVQLYPAENPMCKNFAAELMKNITQTFQVVNTIRLSVGKTKLFYLGEAVLEQEGKDESVPGRLFWAGVREISFHVGLCDREVLSFLGTFRKSLTEIQEGEGDIVTALWDAKFDHITYIAVDDILDLENENDPIPEEFGSEFMNYVDLEMHNLEDEEETERKTNDMADQIRAKINDEDASLFGISNEEREALIEEIAIEESPKMLSDILLVLCETLFMETDETTFVDLVQILSGAMLALIGEGRLGEAGEVLRMLKELRDEGENFTPPMKMVVETGLAASFDETRRRSLVQHLDNARPAALDTLDRFVEALPDTSIKSMCDVLGNLQTPPARRRLIEALSLKAKGDVSPFLPYLRDPRTELVRNIVGVLGASQNDAAFGPLKKLMHHPDFHVRKDSLAGLSKLGTGRALDAVSEGLLDIDPRIRMTAARNLGLAGRVAIPALLTAIEDSDFDDRPLTEKRAFYESLGYAGGEDMIPVFKRALNRKNLFRRTQAAEIRACACEGLGWVGGSEARELVSKYTQDRSILVRTAAQSALRRIAAGGGELRTKEAA